MNEQFENSLKSHRRILSRFHAQEMILDYAEDKLDPERRAAMDEFLPRCKHTQAALSAVRAALKYADQLAQIEVGPELVTRIETTKLGWDKWADQLAWRNWPEIMRWSAEAVVIAATFAALISLLPMHKMARWLPKPAQEVILAEVDKAKDVAMATADIPEPSEKEPMVATTITPPPVIAPSVATAKAASTPAPAEVAASTAAPVAIAAPPPINKLPIVAKTIVAVTKPTKVEPTQPDKTSDTEFNEEMPSVTQQPGKGPKGFVYRAFMSATDTDSTTNTVRDLVLALGGEKAGQVELGWRKNTGTYFHFSLPESNYETLLEALRAYSPVRIYKDPHWRVMPQGEIRIILFVEDLSLKK